MDQQQFDRLPKYAQRYINARRNEIEALKDLIEAQNKEHGDSPISYTVDVREEMKLSRYASIHFRDPKERSSYAGLTATFRDGELTVRSGDGAIQIMPEASNSVRITRRKR